MHPLIIIIDHLHKITIAAHIIILLYYYEVILIMRYRNI